MAEAFPPAPFWRRLTALLYDYLVGASVFALAHFAGFAAVLLASHFYPPLTDGYPDLASFLNASLLYKGYLLACVLGCFLWFWTHGGQTLGMRAWRLKLQNADGTPVRLGQALVRALTGLLGLGLLWMLLRPKTRQALQDGLSGSQVVLLTVEANRLNRLQGIG
ncbi:RDD family protein [Gallaecimonas kandeliae]|uniref:RDD family protein n=1 Tax=Gallaecimonas kandeliae TaxID=3029055 RepID=UPI0026489458|nr:RDD family protein [Gallaecimonas kandeliae]WKE64722.1 RDD family protein [Gallaecimonas kandeliae]